MPKLIRRINADFCFSHTNFLSRRTLPCPSLLLIHNAGYFSEKFTQLHLQHYTKHKDAFLWKQKNNWAYDSIKRATLVTVQTHTLATKMAKRLPVSPEKIVTIPHGLGLLKSASEKPKSFPGDIEWRIGYVTKFGVQKDFNTAIKAISLLKKAGISVKLVLTLNTCIPEYSSVLQQIQHADIEDRVENRGDITDADEIKNIYDSLHLFVFPSLVESFGFTLVEAMASGLPIIAADTESNREVTGIAGQFFPQEDEKALAAHILRLIKNQDLYQLASHNSLEKSQEYSWQKTAKSLINILPQLMKHK